MEDNDKKYLKILARGWRAPGKNIFKTKAAKHMAWLIPLPLAD